MQPLTWQTHEYYHSPKSNDWFWALGIVALAVAFVSVLLGNILFAIFVVLAGFCLALYASRHPKVITVEITSKGVRVNNTIFPFSEIHNFAVAADVRVPSVVLTMKKIFMPHILIPLGDMSAEEVKAALSPKLSEEHYVEPLSVKIFEAFGL